MRVVNHHPKTETLADFSAGRLDEARSVVIATHVATCAQCSQAVSGFEALGGLCLEEVAPVAMASDALEKILARADAGANIVAPHHDSSARLEKQLPLSAYLEGSLDDVNWRRVAPGMSQSVIEAQGYREGVLRLLKIAPGTRMPKHTHEGEELTLILRGAYEDEIGEFSVGDLADLGDKHTHSPKAIGDEPCICLIATAAPLNFKTLTGKLVQPFIGL
ncbi:MAG: ChrR family anti-sigma-E factor [Pseudomonadota bacterium]